MITVSVRAQLLFCILVLVFSFLASSVYSAAPPGSNPAYASYDFGTPGKTVVFASQPMGPIAGGMVELIRRDRILAGQLKRLGLELKVLPFYNGVDINHFIKQGKVSVAMAGDFPTFSIATSDEVQIVAIAKRDKAAVITHKRYQSLKDLAGKRISFPEGTSSQLGLLVALEAAGMKEQAFTMIPMAIDQLVPAITTGQTDAIAGWDPVPSTALAADNDLRIISRFLNTDFMYWRHDFASRNPEAARCILAAYSRAINWVTKSEANLNRAAKWSYESAQAFLGPGKKLQLTQDDMKKWMRQNLTLIGTAAIPATEFAVGGHLQKSFNLLKQKGKLPATADWTRVQGSVQAGLVKEINAAQNRYRTRSFDYEGN